MSDDQRRRANDYDDQLHWEMTRQHNADIADLKESNARQEEVLSSVMRDVSSTRDDIAILVQKVSEPPPSTDLAKIIGVTVSVLTMFGALVFAYIAPMRDDILDAELRIRDLYSKTQATAVDQAYKNGYNAAETNALTHDVRVLYEKVRETEED